MQRHICLAVGCVMLVTTVAAAQEKPALPDGAVARLGVHRLRVPTWIRDAAFMPDGRTFVVIIGAGKANEPTLVYFDVATGLERERKRLPIRKSGSINLAEQKPIAAFSTDEGFEVWDFAAEKLLQRWAEPKWGPEVRALALSPDGTQLAASAWKADQRVLLQWDVATGKAMPPRAVAEGYISSLSFSADGGKLFSASTEAVRPMGDKYVTIPGAITTWDVKTGTKLAERSNPTAAVVFSRDGAKAARHATVDKVEIIDIVTGQRLAEFPGRVDDQFVFTPDSKRFLLYSGGDIRLWDIAAKKDAFEGKAWSRGVVRFSPDEKRVAIIEADTGARYVTFRDMTTGKPIDIDAGHPVDVSGLAYSPDGRRLATCSFNVLHVFDVKTGAQMHRWVGHKDTITQIAFSPDGKLLASASVDGTIALWDAATGKERRRLSAKGFVRSLAFTRDGATLTAVSVNPAVMQNWDVGKGVLHHSHETLLRMVAPSMSPTGQFLASFPLDRGDGPFGTTIHWMNAQTGKGMSPIKLQTKQDDAPGLQAPALAFSPDGKLLASSNSMFGQQLEHSVRVWESATRREILRFTGNPNSTRLLAISPDGRMLAHGIDTRFTWGGHGNDATVILRDLSSGQSVALADTEVRKRNRLIGGHLGRITCLAFSPDGKFLATGGSDQVVYIWRVEHFLKPPALPEAKGNVADYWPHLADADAGKAYRAIAQLERGPKEALILLRKHLQAAPTADEKVVAQHIRDLASLKFAVRQQAQAALEKHGEQAAHLVQQAAKNPPDLEVKRRLEMLLEKLDHPLEDAHQLRAYRCLTLLERIGTPEALQLLEELARGAPAAWLTMEARYSL